MCWGGGGGKILCLDKYYFHASCADPESFVRGSNFDKGLFRGERRSKQIPL